MKIVEVKVYPIKRLNTEIEVVFNSLVAVYDEWHEGFIDSFIDDQVYFWYSQEEFSKLKIGQMMDDQTIYLVDLNREVFTTYDLELEEEEALDMTGMNGCGWSADNTYKEIA